MTQNVFFLQIITDIDAKEEQLVDMVDRSRRELYSMLPTRQLKRMFKEYEERCLRASAEELQNSLQINTWTEATATKQAELQQLRTTLVDRVNTVDQCLEVVADVIERRQLPGRAADVQEQLQARRQEYMDRLQAVLGELQRGEQLMQIGEERQARMLQAQQMDMEIATAAGTGGGPGRPREFDMHAPETEEPETADYHTESEGSANDDSMQHDEESSEWEDSPDWEDSSADDMSAGEEGEEDDGQQPDIVNIIFMSLAHAREAMAFIEPAAAPQEEGEEPAAASCPVCWDPIASECDYVGVISKCRHVFCARCCHHIGRTKCAMCNKA